MFRGGQRCLQPRLLLSHTLHWKDSQNPTSIRKPPFWTRSSRVKLFPLLTPQSYLCSSSPSQIIFSSPLLPFTELLAAYLCSDPAPRFGALLAVFSIKLSNCILVFPLWITWQNTTHEPSYDAIKPSHYFQTICEKCSSLNALWCINTKSLPSKPVGCERKTPTQRCHIRLGMRTGSSVTQNFPLRDVGNISLARADNAEWIIAQQFLEKLIRIHGK